VIESYASMDPLLHIYDVSLLSVGRTKLNGCSEKWQLCKPLKSTWKVAFAER
jgi:hypothetical protein